MVTPRRLVVANDDPDACEVVARVLELDGHEVTRIDHQEAVAGIVNSIGATGLVLDLVDGGLGANLEALERMRRKPGPGGREVRVVLIGAQQSQAAFAWQSGIDGFVLRPFHADELRATVAEALDRSEKDRKPFRERAQERLLG